jgi:hypothetical protein
MATEDDPLQIFESTVFKPDVERRKNDSLMVLLMQEVHKKIDDMDKRLTRQMTNETLILAEEIAKLMNNAFPGSDPLGHRTYHEAQMQQIADRAAFWKAMRIEIGKYGIVGLLGWMLYAAWIAFLKGPK